MGTDSQAELRSVFFCKAQAFGDRCHSSLCAGHLCVASCEGRVLHTHSSGQSVAYFALRMVGWGSADGKSSERC